MWERESAYQALGGGGGTGLLRSCPVRAAYRGVATPRLRRADSALHLSRHLHAPNLVVERRGAGVLQSGVPIDVRVRARGGRAIIPRGREARPAVRDVLLGRSVGVESVSERRPECRARCA